MNTQRTFIFALVSLISLVASAQYNNEWIDFSKKYYKFQVDEDDLYRIPYSAIAQTDLDLEASDFALYNNGREIPIYVSRSAGNFGPGDYIEFYGQRNTGELDTQLFREPDWQLYTERSLFSDVNSYYLTSQTGTRKRIDPIENDLTNPPPAQQNFTYTNKTLYHNKHWGGDPEDYTANSFNHFSSFNPHEGWVSLEASIGNDRDFNFKAPAIDYSAGPVTNLYLSIVGVSNDIRCNPDHHIRVKINNKEYIDDFYEGHNRYDAILNIPISELLADGNNKINLESVGDADQGASCDSGTRVDASAMAHSTIVYPRLFEFENKRHFNFSIQEEGEVYFEVKEFSGGSEIIVYDLLNGLRLTSGSAGTFYPVRLPDGSPAEERKIILANAGDLNSSGQQINSLEEMEFIDYSSSEYAGDFIIITNNRLRVDDEGVDQVERYADYRRSEDGGGHEVLIVEIGQLYDQYAWGVNQHSVAIRSFSNAIIDFHSNGDWTVKPNYLLLLGKSTVYTITRNLAQERSFSFVPTFGNGSDIMLSSRNNSDYTNQLATGRVPALSAEDVGIYLNKLIEYESFQNNVDPCSFEERDWFKRFILVNGGNDNEIDQFGGFLNGYGNQLESYQYGGYELAHYTKNSAEAIINVSDDFKQNLARGVNSLIYFGHSGSDNWAFDIADPFDFDNVGLYPMIFSYSCFVGAIHGPINTFTPAEENDPLLAYSWLFAPDRGCISFLATLGFGFPNSLNDYAENLYTIMSGDFYGHPLSEAIRENVDELEGLPINDTALDVTNQEFTLTGDPGVKMYSWSNPEYYTSEEGISFSPQIISASDESFNINISIHNLGRAVEDSFTLKVERYNELDELVNEKVLLVKGIPYNDTIRVFMQNTPGQDFGKNTFKITIDPENELVEDCKQNNAVEVFRNITPSSAIPISPCDFSIVNDSEVRLLAYTSSVNGMESQYKIQIDTSTAFSPTSAQFAEFTTNTAGGIIEWQPEIDFLNNTVYYWRSTDLNESGVQNWQNRSFLYDPDLSGGWNQSHYYQFTANDYTDMKLDPNSRKFEFRGIVNTLKMQNTNFVTGSGVGGDIEFYRNNTYIFGHTCLSGPCANGVTFVVLKPSTFLDIVQSEIDPERINFTGCDRLGTFGSVICGGTNSFEFNTETAADLDQIATFLDWIPEDYYVMAYSVGNHQLEQNAALASNLQPIYDFFNNMGVPQIEDIDPQLPFIAFGRKNNPFFDKASWLIGDDVDDVISLELAITGAFELGVISSNTIGPAQEWQSLTYEMNNAVEDVHDDVTVQVFAIEASGQDSLVLEASAINGTYDLSFLDATKYPFMRLRAIAKDSINFTSPQLDNWQVHHIKQPDLSFNINKGLLMSEDSLSEGQTGSLSIWVENISSIDVENVEVLATVVSSTNVTTTFPLDPIPLIEAGEGVSFEMEIPSTGLGGQNFLTLELNPNQRIPEKFSFNNFFQTSFFVFGDGINPLVDVTFDGEHILNGDIVSAQSHINIKIKDDNRFLALDDTTVADIFITYPGGEQSRLNYLSNEVSFIAADLDGAGKNEAHIEYHPTFVEDGTYQLRIKAKDKSGNEAAEKDYVIEFAIVTTPSISNVVNYPNPFTSSTRFVYTLTGSKAPENFKIQILTVSGKVVREITQNEMGEQLRVGTHMTDYAWDGKDEFGNELANGVYFYRVYAQLDGQEMDLFTSADGEFRNLSKTDKLDDLFNQYGYGKMYKIR